MFASNRLFLPFSLIAAIPDCTIFPYLEAKYGSCKKSLSKQKISRMHSS